MAEARAYREGDREALLALVRDAYGDEGGEDQLAALIADSVGIWLAARNLGTSASSAARI
jgi:hypothetical protein